MRTVLWASWLLLLLFSGVHGASCSPDREVLPGVYDLASNGQLAISVMDMHMHDEGQGSWITLGLVVENEQNSTTSVDPASFEVVDSLGGTAQASTEYPLMNPLVHRDVGPGGVVVGSLGFELEAGARPFMLVNQGSGLKIRLDKADQASWDIPFPRDSCCSRG